MVVVVKEGAAVLKGRAEELTKEEESLQDI